MGSMKYRAAPAWLGAWEFGIADVAESVGCHSWLELKTQWEALGSTVRRMDAIHERQSEAPTQPHPRYRAG